MSCKKCYVKIVVVLQIENACRWGLTQSESLVWVIIGKSLVKQVGERYHEDIGIIGKIA
ncbi:hypothetical protein [Candidatus Nitrotoga sp. M5]|uniref:hypothetical protein n=1 Tax=Candidatus Nitrotoga sp. M5 TaxID=2890409 RepID=UPI001EF2234D|nr:hypothetical protein [Candidatus Nitrotoga sp. M5]CAH1385986.1 hypothetical protein NTGM5_180045 [Candidatus Nitrotoga sp. M5]